MKLSNRFGIVYKLKGNRRKTYIAIVLQKYIKTSDVLKCKRCILGYYITKEEVLIALTKLLSNYSMRTYKVVFSHSFLLHKIIFKDVRSNDLECTIENAFVAIATKAKIKSMYNLTYKYVFKYDIFDK